MDRNAQRRRTSREQEQIRELKRRRIRRRKIIRVCLHAGTLLSLVVLVGGMGRLLSVNASAGQREETVGNTIIMEEEELIKPKEEVTEPVKMQTMPQERPLLVNKENPLPDNYDVKLITLPDRRGKAAEEAYEPLMEMLREGTEEGLDLLVCSSYRDRERQEELFDEDMEELLRKGYTYAEAYDEVAKETMPPGCSEHSTGLAFDIVARDYQMLDKGQEKTEENKWLREHCAEYGFILRYPKGKEEITDIHYESWHFRYVGKEVAEYIMEEGITLEEYLEKLENTY